MSAIPASTAAGQLRALSGAGLAAQDRLALRLFTIDFVLVVMTQKLAFPLGGRETQVTAAMLIHLAFLAYLGLRGGLRIVPARLMLFSTFMAVAAMSQLPNLARSVSLPSMVLMLSISAMLLFVTPISTTAYHVMLRRFVLVAVVAAALVGIDWAVQVAGFAMPDLEALMPRALVYYEYNYIQPLEWNSPWMKPNGLFFLEASHVSQFIGLGLVIEIALFRRLPVIAALGTALFGTFGVTGIVLVALCAPLLLARARTGAIVAVLALTPVGGLVAYQSGVLDNFLRRTAEFSQRSSSGYNRFVLPVEWSITALTGPAEKAWLGTGAGSMPKAINNDEDDTAGYTWPPYTKVGVEYGSLALALWLMFIGRSLTGEGIPLVVSWAAFVQYNFLNGSLNVPIHTIYCALLCAGFAVAQPRRAAPRADSLMHDRSRGPARF